MSSHSATKEWKRFLMEAGLNKDLALHYAEVFAHHRMRMSMLPDLNKDILFFMGIEVMGDVIAILKHAKQVSVNLGYSKDYENAKSHTSTNKSHRRERSPPYRGSRPLTSNWEVKPVENPNTSPIRRNNSKTRSNQAFSSFQNFPRDEKRSKYTPDINVTITNTDKHKYFRESEVTESQSSGRYQYQMPANRLPSTSYSNRSRSRSPIFSKRLHMDQSPGKVSVRSRISSRPEQRIKRNLSPVPYMPPQRATSHASSSKYPAYRAPNPMNHNEFSRIETGRMYSDMEDRRKETKLSSETFVTSRMPSLTIHVDNRGSNKNKREIRHQDNSRRPANNSSWQHDDRDQRGAHYPQNTSLKSNYYNRPISPISYEQKNRHVSVFNRLT